MCPVGERGRVSEIEGQREVRDMLRVAGLRPTRQRVALAELLYSHGNRHISAELLHEEAEAAHVPVSLATVYNTLLGMHTKRGELDEARDILRQMRERNVAPTVVTYTVLLDGLARAKTDTFDAAMALRRVPPGTKVSSFRPLFRATFTNHGD